MEEELKKEISEDVCQTQIIFNDAFEKAVKNYQLNEIKRMTTGRLGSIYTIATVIYFAFILWAVILAMKIKDQEQRVLHITVALVTGPAYVFGYYLSR